MTRKPPRLVVLALLFWQIAVSMGVTAVHAAARLEQLAPTALSGHGASTDTLLAAAAEDCPNHATAGAASHDRSANPFPDRYSSNRHSPNQHSSNHSSKHDCCGTTSACECATAAILFAAPIFTASQFATPVPLLAYTGAATARVAPFFRPPIA